VVEWAIDSYIKQFSTNLGELFEPSPREPVRDVPHLMSNNQPGATGIRGSADKHIGNVSTRNAPGTMALST